MGHWEWGDPAGFIIIIIIINCALPARKHNNYALSDAGSYDIRDITIRIRISKINTRTP